MTDRSDNDDDWIEVGEKLRRATLNAIEIHENIPDCAKHMGNFSGSVKDRTGAMLFREKSLKVLFVYYLSAYFYTQQKSH